MNFELQPDIKNLSDFGIGSCADEKVILLMKSDRLMQGMSGIIRRQHGVSVNYEICNLRM